MMKHKYLCMDRLSTVKLLPFVFYVLKPNKNNMDTDLQVLIETADFAARKHKDQRRKDSAETPYINHPIGSQSLFSFIPRK